MTSMLLSALLTLAIPLQGGTLSYKAPEAWKPRAPASSMRVAEFAVPRAPGDPEDGEVVIFYFGGGGGSVDANVQRWIGQFKQDPSKTTKDAGRTSFNVGNLKITMVDVSGTYIAEVRPGAAERHNKPDFRMLAAVVETPKGPYYVKFTGPEKTVGAAAPAFDQFLKSLRFP